MNVSRSGRVRKKSTILIDSEFHTPRESVIYGLSSLESKVLQSSACQTLKTQNEQIELLDVTNKGKLQFISIMHEVI